MGCWNGTCGISRLPIMAGDKTRFFFLIHDLRRSVKDASDDVTLYYPTDNWRPIGPPLLGEYDEYGRIEAYKENLLTRYYEWYFTQHKLEFTEHTRLSLDDVDLKSPLKIGTLIEAAERGGMSYSDFGKYRVKEMLVLEHVYRKVVDTEFDWPNQYDFRGYSKKRYHAMVPEFLNLLKQEKPKDSLKASHERFMRTNMGRSRCNLEAIIFGSEIQGPALRQLGEFLEEQPEVKGVKQLMGELADFLTFNGALHFLRASYGPQSGAGSQEDDDRLHLAVADAVREVAATRKAEWEAENEGVYRDW